jgi:hypothetical protein
MARRPLFVMVYTKRCLNGSMYPCVAKVVGNGGILIDEGAGVETRALGMARPLRLLSSSASVLLLSCYAEGCMARCMGDHTIRYFPQARGGARLTAEEQAAFAGPGSTSPGR